MDRDYLSKKRYNDEKSKSSSSNSNNFNQQNPFFDFSDNLLIEDRLQSISGKSHKNINHYNPNQRPIHNNFHNNEFKSEGSSNGHNSYNKKNYSDSNYTNFRRENVKNNEGNHQMKSNVNYIDNHTYNMNKVNNFKQYENNNYSQGVIVEKNKLPIEKYREVILNYIKNNQVLVIAGETGCGKTTQVPKYIYDDYLKRNDNSLNMIITQPRRIAAVSIAKRLSEELNVTNGKEVGYHVGRNPVFDSEKTKILIVTTGIFLQRLIHEKELSNVSHVILDEVHERDIDIDFVMILIKHMLKKHLNLKLILMSATISTHLFANYFSKENIEKIEDMDFYRNITVSQKKDAPEQSAWDDIKESVDYNENIDNSWDNNNSSKQVSKNNVNQSKSIKYRDEMNRNAFLNLNEINPAPVIKIDEKIYPVKIEYLNEIIEKYIDPNFAKKLPSQFQFERLAPRIADYIFDIATMLIQRIHYEDKHRNFFSILVFLPGFFEIQSMNEKILSYMENEERNIEILQLHSGISDEEQSLVFKKKDKRKIILSTNIAESSITIPDIYFVIDFCLCKELKCNIKTNNQTLELNWASKASCNQRAGRAGRVSNGFVYRLINRDFYDYEISDFSSPELIRTPLEKLILKIKVWDCGEPEKILGRAIEPPNIKHIYAAIHNLQNYGALTIPNDKSKTGELTELGKVYSELPIDIKYSRFIMLSFCFDIVEPVIIVCSILSQDKTLFKNKKRSFEIVLAGAFYGNFMKCGYFNYEKIQKMSKCKEYNPQHAISVKCIIPAIKDTQIQDFFRKYGKIAYFKRYGEEVIIAYAKENYQDSIKKVLLCGGYKYSTNEFVIDYKPENFEKFVPFQLKRPEYLYQLKFYDVFSQNQVEIESNSVNHVMITDIPKSVSSFFLVTEHYHTKKQKFHSMITAKLPEIPMLDYLLMLVFSPYVNFYSNEDNSQYHMFRILGSELEFRFTHLFSSVDVEEINYIRSLMNNIIKDVYDETKIASQRIALIEQIKILINKKRAKIISKSEWWDLLYKHYPHLEKKINYGGSNKWEIKNKEESEQCLDQEKKNNDFLPQIKKLEGLRDHRLFMDDGKLEIEEERKCFIEMRKNIINYYEEMKNAINLTDTEVICKVCMAYICMARNLVCLTDRNEFHEITGYIGSFVEIIPFNDDVTKDVKKLLTRDIFCKTIQSEYEYDTELSWIACSKKHIIGVHKMGKYYITNDSNILLRFPTIKIEEWTEKFYNENYKRIKMYEDECLKERKKKIQDLYCELCDIRRFKDSNEFITHIEKNAIHKQIMTELLEEEF